MSAFIVSKAHIDALVQAGLSYGQRGRLRWRVAEPDFHAYPDNLAGYSKAVQAVTRELDHMTADRVGAMLWTENVMSVRHRYADVGAALDLDNAPGPVGLTVEDVTGYTFPVMSAPRVDAVGILKALACYEYQTCEHPEWPTSEAKAFCDVLRHYAINALPGYEDAEWEITRPAPKAPRPKARRA